MIRVAEHVARTDTGHQRATNEDSHLERALMARVGPRDVLGDSEFTYEEGT